MVEPPRDLPPGLRGTRLGRHLAALDATGQGRVSAALLLDSGFPQEAAARYAAAPQNPFFRAGLVRTALRRGHVGRARALLAALLASQPDGAPSWRATLAGLIEACGGDARDLRDGLPPQEARLAAAQAAMKAGDAASAARLWEALLQDFPPQTYWQVQRAAALARLGEMDEAQDSLQNVLAADPWALGALRQLLRLKDRLGQSTVMASILAQSAFADAAVPVLFPAHMRLFFARRNLAAAHEAAAAQLRHAGELAVLEMLFNAAPQLHDGEALMAFRHTLRECLAMLPLASDAAEQACAFVLHARIAQALDDEGGLAAAAEALTCEPAAPLRTAVQRAAARIERGSVKIFCIGLSRTGTTSLASALAVLGFDVPHWTNPLTGALVSIDDLGVFDGMSDIPAADVFETCYRRFPGAKFIYSTRPLSGWEPSFTTHFRRVHHLKNFAAIQAAASENFAFGAAYRGLIQRLYLRYPSAAAAYTAHDTRVRNFFADKPAGCFLEFSVFAGDGWNQLCSFLGMATPETAFPFENRQATM